MSSDMNATQDPRPSVGTSNHNGSAIGANILVVDDEQYMRAIISRWLSEAGYTCAEAAGADAAWDYLQQHDVQLVTLDVSMPGRSGADLLPQIKERFPDTEVLMLTALGQAELAIQMLTNGAYGYLIKPVEPEELVFQARKALERRQFAYRNDANTPETWRKRFVTKP